MSNDFGAFTADESIPAPDGWAIGTCSNSIDKYYLPIPSIAARHTESGIVYALTAYVNGEKKTAGSVFLDALTGTEGDLATRKAAEKQAIEILLQAPIEVRQGMIEKTRRLETEYEASGMVDRATHFLLENIGVEGPWQNRYEYRNAAEVKVGEKEWVVRPTHTLAGKDNEILFLPALFDKGTGQFIASISPHPDPDDPSMMGEDLTIHFPGDSGPALEDFPAPVRRQWAALAREMADTFHMHMNENLYTRIAGTSEFIPSAEELSALVEASVTPLQGSYSPYLQSQLIKAGETAWEAATQRITTQDTVFALRPVFTNMETGEAFSVRAEAIAEVDCPAQKRKVNAVSTLVCEELQPGQKQISFTELCERVPQVVRSHAQWIYDGIGSKLNIQFSKDLCSFVTMPSPGEAQAPAINDAALEQTVTGWAQQFERSAGKPHADQLQARRDSSPGDRSP